VPFNTQLKVEIREKGAMRQRYPRQKGETADRNVDCMEFNNEIQRGAAEAKKMWWRIGGMNCKNLDTYNT